jgi:plastocyanin
MKLKILIVLAVAVALFAGLATANTAQVLIKDFKFQPDQITIQRGGTITWTHPEPASHTVKFADSESPILKNGSTYSKTFSKPSTFPYSCGIHPYMHGNVAVK